MFDPSKLSPAPWSVVSDSLEPSFKFIPGASGAPMLWPEHDKRDDHMAALEFAADARNAFDIQMRRGWSAFRSDDGRWYVPELLDKARTFTEWLKEIAELYRDDPVTAIIAADDWMKAREALKLEEVT